MISLSDKVKDEFQQINISDLEILDEEKIHRDKDEELDWETFKVIYQDLKAEQKETDIFKELFNLEEEEKPIFEQFGEEKSEKSEKTGYEIEIGGKELSEAEEINKSERESSHGKADESSEESFDLDKNDADLDSNLKPEQGYEQGYKQGFENGKKDGYEKGLQQGEKEGREKGLETGYAEGYSKGESQASEDNEVKITEKAEEFKEMLLKLDNTYQELATRYEDKIISLICAIAEKVVLAKVEIDDEIVKLAVLDALKTLPEPEEITLSVSNEDYEYIEMVKEDLFEFINTLKSVSVKSDTSVKRGGCRIETKQGYIEADIEEKLKKVFASIKGKTKA